MKNKADRETARINQLLRQIDRTLEDPAIACLLDEARAASHFPRAFDDPDAFSECERPDDLAENADPELLADDRYDATLQVEVAADAMTASAVVTPPIGEGDAMTIERAMKILSDAGVIHGIENDALGTLLRSLDVFPVSALVARGTPPSAGEAERWDLTTAPARSGVTVGERDRVDYRVRSTVRATAVGDLLALRIPARPGMPGRDVMGRPIPPPTPLPGSAPYTAGEGVEAHEDGIYATAEGEMRIDEDGRISVLPILVVDGNVDFSTGNIQFPGTVHIRGSVEDGFLVCAGGDIEIGGAITAARVEAKGSVIVEGGIICREHGWVIAGRDVRAKFIENATVEARGSVYVRRAILHSHVYALGEIEVGGEPGGIAGGVLYAGRALRCHTLGSNVGTRTHVVFGVDYLLWRRLELIEKALNTLRDRLRETDTSLHRLNATAPAGGDATPGEDHHPRHLLGNARERLAESIRKLMKSRGLVLRQIDSGPHGEVAVSGDTLPGVVLSSRGVDRVLDVRAVRTRFRRHGRSIESCPFT